MRVLLFSLFLALSGMCFGQNVLTIKPNAQVGKDASVFSNNPTANYGNRSELNLYTWTNSGNLGLKRVYLVFPLGGLPSSSQVDSAKLSLFFNPSDEIEGFSTHSGNTDFFIERVTSIWTEYGINWNNQPTSTNQNRVSVPAHNIPTQNFLNLDVSQLVLDMLGQNQQNFGFCLKMQNELNPYRGLLFASSDHNNSSLWPELKVYYHISTGLSDHDSKFNQLAIFPNPSQGNFTLSLADNSSVQKLQVLDQTGRIIHESAFQTQLDLREQAAGIYFLRLQDFSGNQLVKKLIIH